jgi:hypothetical protein
VIPVYYLSVQPLLFISIVIHGIRCSIFGVKENKIIPSSLNPGTPETANNRPVKRKCVFCQGDSAYKRGVRLVQKEDEDFAHQNNPIVITRRMSIPAPKQEMSTPDTRLMDLRF